MKFTIFFYRSKVREKPALRDSERNAYAQKKKKHNNNKTHMSTVRTKKDSKAQCSVVQQNVFTYFA